MFKILFVLFLFCVGDAFGGNVEEKENKNEDSGRQKRLLFYDEEGNIVKTYTNPFLRNYYLNQGNVPGVGYLSPFLEFLRPPQLQSLPNPINYMLPLSDVASQQNDPIYQNKLIFQLRDQSIEFNPLCSNKRVQIPSPRSCSNFLNCWDGWAYEQECPQGLMFSNQGFCDYADNVNCHDRKVIVQADEPQAQEEATCSKEFDTFRNEAKCSEFFVCVNRSPVKFKCPDSLFFNQELGVCDYQNRVSCNAGFGIAPELPTSQAQSLEKESSSSAMPPAAPTMVPAATVPAPMAPAPMAPALMVPMPQKNENQPKPLVKLFMMGNTMTNTQSWTSTRVAMGRQDAIRQLELNRLAKIKANY